jgi:hypothetical protein
LENNGEKRPRTEAQLIAAAALFVLLELSPPTN